MELALIDNHINNKKCTEVANLVHYVPVPNINKTLSYQKN